MNNQSPFNNKEMEDKENSENIEDLEKPDNWWYRIYLAVIVTNIATILILWSFTEYFSN